MSFNLKKYGLFLFTLILLILVIVIFFADWKNSHNNFSFTMLDVGQGDALFIESPTGTQILVDAGPPRKILGSLSKIMSPFDKSIDAVIITNPDQDHIGGLADVLKNYKVGKVFESGTWSDSKTYQNLEKEIENKNIPNILVRKGMRLDLGGETFLDILFPDRDVTNWPTNDGSVVAMLSYGDMKILLTGDAPEKTEDLILKGNSIQNLRSDILKVGHHGSRTSTSDKFLKAISPHYAFVSVGKDNKYGHPHQEILNILGDLGVKILRTDQDGTVILKCDKMKVCKIKK